MRPPTYFGRESRAYEEQLGDGLGEFAPGSRAVPHQLSADAVLADEAASAACGLNAVSDGRQVVMPSGASQLAEAPGRLAAQPTRRLRESAC